MKILYHIRCMKKMMTISYLFLFAFSANTIGAQTLSITQVSNKQLLAKNIDEAQFKPTDEYQFQTEVQLSIPASAYSQTATQSKSNPKPHPKKNKSKQPKHRIVMQLTSADTLAHKSTIKQINNLKEGWGQDVEIELVCHGPGLNLLRMSTSKFEKQLIQLKEKGVVIYACENTLKERNIPREDVFGHFDFVKMGIGEVVEKQEQGWSYIKAGF